MDRLTDEQIDLMESNLPMLEHYDTSGLKRSFKTALSDLRHYKQENASLLQVIEEQKQALEWASRVIGSGLDMNMDLRYDPVDWIRKYHAEWKQ